MMNDEQEKFKVLPCYNCLKLPICIDKNIYRLERYCDDFSKFITQVVKQTTQFQSNKPDAEPLKIIITTQKFDNERIMLVQQYYQTFKPGIRITQP